MAAEALGDALKHASAIVRRIAEHFDADLAMLFVVADDQLVLRGEYLRLGGALLEPADQDAGLAYPLDWEHPGDAEGLTASVAVSGEAKTLLSLEALRGDPSHRGRWDERVYPNGLDDPQTGFGATIAIPLKNAERGSPRESVLGVLKIERRRGAAVFNETERAAVAAVARHLSAVLRDPSANTTDTAEAFFPILELRVDPMRATRAADQAPAADREILTRTAQGLRGLGLPPEYAETALANIAIWLGGESFRPYRPQLERLIEGEKWEILLDSFYRVIPFGTGGRRGPVGIGTNRFNHFTLASSVQGHVEYLRVRSDVADPCVVIAYDVRTYNDLRGIYSREPSCPNPLMGMTSREFARTAAGVYAANGFTVYMLPDEATHFVSTPELSFTIRALAATAGLNISASHNHPDDNGGKFYNRHGGQEIPPDDERMAEHVEKAENVISLDFDAAVRAGRIQRLDPQIHADYIAMNQRQSLCSARDASVIFTPLHGTGDSTVGETLRASGFRVEVVPEEQEPDGAFPAVPYRAPNPEVPESMQRGERLAAERAAELVMACDPDADRIGCCARAPDGSYRFLNGNEIAVVVTHYKLDQLQKLGRLPRNPIVIKTEVTTELLRAVTEAFGGRLIGDLLVGFKYHGAVLRSLEEEGGYRGVPGTLDDFVVAVEESHGVLVTPEVRDKDAAGAAILLAELASTLRAEGRTLTQYLDDIYRRFGYYATHLSSMVMTGADGVDAIARIQQSLRSNPPTSIAGLRVEEVLDHWDEAGSHGQIKSETDRSSRNVLVFKLEGGARIIIRPSGTEPKNKTYVELPGRPLGMQATESALRDEQIGANRRAEEIADDFSDQMLEIVEVDLPRYALHISGLVALDNRVDFAKRFVSEFETRVAGCDLDEGSLKSVGTWLDERLARYGPDARGLVGRALREFVAGELSEPGIASRRTAVLESMRSFFD